MAIRTKTEEKVGETRSCHYALAERIGLDVIYTSNVVTDVIQEAGAVNVCVEDTRTEPFAAAHGSKRRTQDALPSRRQSFTGGYCICTVPARVLAKIRFSPRLSNAHVEAARELQYARIMKTVVLFEDRFWKTNPTDRTKFSCFTDGVSDFVFDATLGQEADAGILCSYAIGDKADDLAACGTEQLRRFLEQDLRGLFPGKRTDAIAIARYAWQEDKYTEGAYAFYRPGQWFPVSDALKQRHECVYFAGEHLAEEQGFMEGAIDSGCAAAELVMKAH